MTLQKADLLECREVIYQILSFLYYEPTKDLSAKVSLLVDALDHYDSELAEQSKTLINYLEKNNDLMTLKVDFAKLFVGPFHVSSPPYASVYLENKWEVMGGSTVTAVEFYRKTGLVIKDEFKEPPDHIGVQLEFVYYLIYQYIETSDPQFITYQREFFTKYLCKWVPKFTKAIKENANTSFYKNLALLTERLIEKDFQHLRSYLME